MTLSNATLITDSYLDGKIYTRYRESTTFIMELYLAHYYHNLG